MALTDDIPVFFHRSAFTRELFDVIQEMRLSTTSGGLAENIKRTFSSTLIAYNV